MNASTGLTRLNLVMLALFADTMSFPIVHLASSIHSFWGVAVVSVCLTMAFVISCLPMVDSIFLGLVALFTAEIFVLTRIV